MRKRCGLCNKLFHEENMFHESGLVFNSLLPEVYCDVPTRRRKAMNDPTELEKAIKILKNVVDDETNGVSEQVEQAIRIVIIKLSR